MCFSHGAACCHPCHSCLVSSLCLEEPSVGYLPMNPAGLCLFPASPDCINKASNCGIKRVGAFHHQRALELHLRHLFVPVETTRTVGWAGQSLPGEPQLAFTQSHNCVQGTLQGRLRFAAPDSCCAHLLPWPCVALWWPRSRLRWGSWCRSSGIARLSLLSKNCNRGVQAAFQLAF